jgi:3-hydroxyacyl-[acyl-carrier-protein] dehydratase
VSDSPVSRYTVPVDHPSLPGHFPGRPILPGVVLLDAVFHAAGVEPAHLLRAKFAAPVGPGDEVEIRFSRKGEDRLGFACLCRGVTVLSGEVAACAPPPAPPR